MSVYQVNKLIHSVIRDQALLETFMSSPDEVLKQFDLTDEEKAAVRALDMQKLYEMGVHPIMLMWCRVIQRPAREIPKPEES